VLDKLSHERRASMAPRGSACGTPHIMVSEASIQDPSDSWSFLFGPLRRASTQSMGPVETRIY